MVNEKDNTINNMIASNESSDNQRRTGFNENDTIEVNNLITLADSDITPDLLEQLENKAKEEDAKLGEVNVDNLNSNPENTTPEFNQDDINVPTGMPADDDGAVNVTAEILERPRPQVDENPSEDEEEQLDPLEEAKLNAVYKKYVIYINNDNEKFIDSLSILERKEIINKVLYDQNTLTEAQLKERKQAELMVKILICVVTFIITVPLIYFIFNVCMEATIQNYKHSKSNFEVLYKETGKIKMNK